MPDLHLIHGGRMVRNRKEALEVLESEFSRFVNENESPPRYLLVHPRVLAHLLGEVHEARSRRGRRHMRWNGVEIVACPAIATALGVLSALGECSRYLESTR